MPEAQGQMEALAEAAAAPANVATHTTKDLTHMLTATHMARSTLTDVTNLERLPSLRDRLDLAAIVASRRQRARPPLRLYLLLGLLRPPLVRALLMVVRSRLAAPGAAVAVDRLCALRSRLRCPSRPSPTIQASA